MLRAIIFDVDGTLIDSKEFILGAFEYTFSVHGLKHLTRGDIDRVMGKPLDECYRILTPNADIGALTETHRAFQTERAKDVRPFPKTIKTLEMLKARRVNIATLSVRKHLSLESLHHAGISHLVDCVMTGNDVLNPKPHPEGILKALKIFAVSPEDVLMVGDTHIDVETGKNAGVRTAAALYGIGTRESLIASQPDYLFSDIEDVLSI